jgi:3D (Asp-Asp-Asp) domain-containing protein
MTFAAHLMNKPAGLLIVSILLLNSVLVPLQANAATVSFSVTTSTESTADVMTTPNVQELPAAPLTTAAAYTVTLTSYNAVPAQTSPTPWITASGAASNSQVIAARSRDLASKLPYGTIIAIYGPSTDEGPNCGYDSVQNLIGYRVIADSMAARMHNKVDVMLNQHDKVAVGGQMINPAVALGACTGVTVQVVGYVDPSAIPATQAQLASIVTGSNQLASAQF